MSEAEGLLVSEEIQLKFQKRVHEPSCNVFLTENVTSTAIKLSISSQRHFVSIYQSFDDELRALNFLALRRFRNFLKSGVAWTASWPS